MSPRTASFFASLALLATGFAAERPVEIPPIPPPPAFAFEDYLVASIRVHLLASPNEPALCTTLIASDIERIVGKVNRVWSQAGLCFTVESVIREEPAPAEPPKDAENLRGLLRYMPSATYRADLFNVYYVKQLNVNGVFLGKAIFVKDTASLRRVEGGIDEPLPRVTSHELGHAVGLAHRQDTYNLMASGTTGTTLNAAEIEAVRKQAGGMNQFGRAPDLLAKADALQKAGKVVEARESYVRLAALPLTGEPLARVRRLLEDCCEPDTDAAAAKAPATPGAPPAEGKR